MPPVPGPPLGRACPAEFDNPGMLTVSGISDERLRLLPWREAGPQVSDRGRTILRPFPAAGAVLVFGDRLRDRRPRSGIWKRSGRARAPLHAEPIPRGCKGQMALIRQADAGRGAGNPEGNHRARRRPHPRPRVPGEDPIRIPRSLPPLGDFRVDPLWEAEVPWTLIVSSPNQPPRPRPPLRPLRRPRQRGRGTGRSHRRPRLPPPADLVPRHAAASGRGSKAARTYHRSSPGRWQQGKAAGAVRVLTSGSSRGKGGGKNGRGRASRKASLPFVLAFRWPRSPVSQKPLPREARDSCPRTLIHAPRLPRSPRLARWHS